MPCGHGFSEIEMSHGSLLSDGCGIPLIFATICYPLSRPLVAIYLVLEYVSTTYFIWYFTTVDHGADMEPELHKTITINAGAEKYVVLFSHYMYVIPIEGVTIRRGVRHGRKVESGQNDNIYRSTVPGRQSRVLTTFEGTCGLLDKWYGTVICSGFTLLLYLCQYRGLSYMVMSSIPPIRSLQFTMEKIAQTMLGAYYCHSGV